MADTTVDEAKALIRILRGTRQEAVDSAIKETLDKHHASKEKKGVRDDTEFGTVLLACEDGTYRYSEPNAGPKGGAWKTTVRVPKGCNIDSIVHNHPSDTYSHAGISEHDIEQARQLKGATSYVVTEGLRPGDTLRTHERQPDGSILANGRLQTGRYRNK